MKKVVLAVFAVVLIVTSCSKENKLNKKLDGDWNITKLDDNAVPSGTTYTMTFAKDKKGKGTLSMHIVMTTPAAYDTTITGTYELEGDETMYSTVGTEKDTATFTEYSKTTLKWTSNGKTNEATKK